MLLRRLGLGRLVSIASTLTFGDLGSIGCGVGALDFSEGAFNGARAGLGTGVCIFADILFPTLKDPGSPRIGLSSMYSLPYCIYEAKDSISNRLSAIAFACDDAVVPPI